MSLTDRIGKAQQAAAARGEVAAQWRPASAHPVTVDGLGDFKAKVHDSLFERLGTRLFEATNEELEEHVNLYKKQYANNPRMVEQFDQPEARRDIANRLLTEKTVDRLVELNTK